MTVRDLVICAGGFLQKLDVEISDNGKFVYGYRIGLDAQVYYAERCDKLEERRGQFVTGVCSLRPGEVVEVYKIPPADCPTRVMCIKPEKAPAEVLDLEVNYYLPRHTSGTNNNFDLDVVCYLPDLMIAADKVKDWIIKNHSSLKADLMLKEAGSEDIKGQMSLDQFYQTEKV